MKTQSAEIKRGSGTQFDPNIVEAFLPIAGQFIDQFGAA